MSYIEGKKDHGNLPIKAIVPILAEDRTIDGAVVKERFGLKELTELSYELLPNAQKRAFAAAQTVSAELQKKAAYSAIAIAGAAAAAGANIWLENQRSFQKGLRAIKADIYSTG